ncbi:hypothetical protein [Agromyces neolithicus]|uniref:Uncharacterized protein n=1 Tax=Agromyces neolithicus TaxID=269420 RepID=A0ABN2M8Q1_9MICO
MTLDTSSPEATTPPSPAPPAPAPPTPTPPVPTPPQSGTDPTGATPPPRPKGLVLALTLAIIVSVIPVILLPVAGMWLAVTSFTQTQQVISAIEAEQPADTGTDGAAGAALPVELPLDVEIPGPAYVAVTSGFAETDEWVALAEGGVNGFEYENSSTGCYVWYTNGSVGTDVDVANGDRAASIALIESALGATVDLNLVEHGTMSAIDGAAFGTVDAVEADFEGEGFAATAVARTFAGIGEGVVFYVECADEAQRADAVATARDLLYITLVPAGEGLE